MQQNFSCPICNKKDWNIIETYKYTKSDFNVKQKKNGLHLRRFKIISRILWNPKPRNKIINGIPAKSKEKQINILFNIWHQKNTTITLNAIYCQNCTFACYEPRPSEQDIFNKYQHLKQKSTHNKTEITATYNDKIRSKRIHDLIFKHIDKDHKKNILDYGGGSGTLLHYFIKNDHDCFLIDYEDKQIPGVHKVGNDLESLEGEGNKKLYDIILINHVLEHLTDPVNTLNKIQNIMSDDGVIYAEVPSEILAGLRIENDPVTHINFYTEKSFINLFIACNYQIIACQKKVLNYGSAFSESIYIVAKKFNHPTKHDNTFEKSDIKKYLYPSRINSLKTLSEITLKTMINKIKNYKN